MSINPIEDNSTPKHTGSLEELFRHHLGEEAAVPPRPMLWDQIDNSLLIRQNEIYRKRLAATRWVAAASMVLASLAGTGWWVGRTQLLGGAEMAATGQPSASSARTGGANQATGASASRQAQELNGAPTNETATPYGTEVAAATSAAGRANGNQLGDGALSGAVSSDATSAGAASQRIGSANRVGMTGSGSADLAVVGSNVNRASASRYTGFSSGTARFQAGAGRAAARSNAANNGNAPAGSTSITATVVAASGTQLATNQTDNQIATTSLPNAAGTSNAAAGQTLSTSGLATTGVAATGLAAGTDAAGATFAAAAPTAVASAEVGMLATRQAALSLGDATALPNGLATVPMEAPTDVEAHRWHYSASYAASVFNPNINFSRKGIEPEFDYDRSPAFGADSPKLTETAATEYRNNLRPGLSQRIALLATRHLRGHWSLSTGAEFTQATAQSSSSSAFVGEQLFDLGQPGADRPMRNTNFRYSMASIPLEVRYSNPVKRGWSLYGRLGGMVTALLGVRSDVDGDPEATRTYSIASAGTPYRRVMGSVRGGAGTQFRTSTGKWAFTMGPTAEIGLTALNAHPVQSYFAQSHPYSFGLEAGVEFGR